MVNKNKYSFRIILKVSLFLFLLPILSCKKGNVKGEEPEISVFNIRFSLTVENNNNQKVKEAHVVISSKNNKNRSVRVAEGATDSNGDLTVMIGSGLQGSSVEVTIIASGYEPKKINYKIVGTEKESTLIKIESASSLSILSYNVFEGFKNNNVKKNDFSVWIKNYEPDFILFQEMNKFTDKSLEIFAESYGHNYSALLKYDGYPTAITSRYPLTNITKVRTGQTHGYIYAKSNGIHLFSAHLSPRSLADRIKEAKAIVEHANSLPKGEKIIIAGDLNSYNEFDSKAYPPFFEERKKYAPNVDMNFEATNSFLNAGFKDAYALLNSMFKATVPILNNKNGKPNQGSRYDYIYLSKELAANCIYSDVLQNNYTDYASDHYPVYIRINK